MTRSTRMVSARPRRTLRVAHLAQQCPERDVDRLSTSRSASSHVLRTKLMISGWVMSLTVFRISTMLSPSVGHRPR